jgi:hypothetical protein
LECELIVVSERFGWVADEAVDASSVHEVGTHEAGELEGAWNGLLVILSPAQEQEGDEGDGDLDAHGVLGGSEEVADFECLLDPAEEQLDGPTALVEVGDFLGRGLEVIAEDAQDFAGVGLDAHLANRVAEGIFSALSLALWQQPNAVGEDVGSFRQVEFSGYSQGRIGLEAGDDAAAGGMQAGPPGVVVVSEIKDIGRPCLYPPASGRSDYVEFAEDSLTTSYSKSAGGSFLIVDRL